MGWLLSCFKGTGKPERAKPKKQLSGVVSLVSGRPNSAAVAHATSPEDLHRVRKSPTNLAAAISNGYVDRGGFDSSSSSLPPVQAQAKKNEGAKFGSKRNDADNVGRAWSHNELELDRELESFRKKLMQEADAAKHLSDEVKYLRACRDLLESPSNTFKVTFDKSDKDSTGKVDYAQHSWLVSSLVTRIQPRGLLIEACSKPSSPFPTDLHEGGSLHSRAIRASQSIDFDDNFGNSNALKCAELNLFRVESGVDGIQESLHPTQCEVELKTESAPLGHEAQSPPWTFSEAKLDVADHKNPCIFESSDNLLLEHLDVSSLIEDSALITNWELSFGELHTEQWSLHGQSLHGCQVPSQEEGKLLVTSHSSAQKKQKRPENGPEGESLDCDSSCSMVVPEAPSDDGTGSFAHPLVGEASCSSDGMPSEAEVPHDDSCNRESIYAEECRNINPDAEARLFRAESCMATEESDNETTSQSCFSSQFRLSKRLWSSTRKNPFEKESSMEDYLHHNDNEVQEVLLLGTHSEMPLWQQSKNSDDEYYPLLGAPADSSETRVDSRVSHTQYAGVHMDKVQSSNASSLEGLVRQYYPLLDVPAESGETCVDNRVSHIECVDVHMDNAVQSSNASSLEALIRQNSVDIFVLEDERKGHSNMVYFPTEKENEEQRKKIRLGHSSSFERVHESMLVEDEQVRLLDSAAFGDDHERSLEGRADIFDGQQSSAPRQFWNESSFKQTSDLSLAPSSPSYIQMPSPPVASYRSPARLADDRPILGTVAAHWSPITTRKWWDGKGIPNSTNKYKEDQKVNWHVIPFEVRLEQALAKQDSVLSK